MRNEGSLVQTVVEALLALQVRHPAPLVFGAELRILASINTVRRHLGAVEAPLAPQAHHPVPLVLNAELHLVAPIHAVERLLNATLMAACLELQVPIPSLLCSEQNFTLLLRSTPHNGKLLQRK